MNIRERAIGLHLIRVGIIVSIFLSILSISNLIYMHFMDPFENVELYFKRMQFFNLLTFIFLWLYLVLIGTGIGFMMKDMRYNSPKQKRNLKLAFIFFWLSFSFTLLIFIFPQFYDRSNLDLYHKILIFRTVLFGSIELIWRFFGIMVLILPVWRLSNDRSKDILFILFVTLFFISPVYYLLLIPINIIIPIFINPLFYFIAYLIPNLIIIFVRVLLVIVYSKDIRISEDQINIEEKKIISDKFLFRGKFTYLIKKPIPVIIILFVIGLLIGSASGIRLYRDTQRWGGSDNRNFNFLLRDSILIENRISDQLSEGDQKEHVIDIGENVSSINISLIWNDENAARLMTNHPDTFTLSSSFEQQSSIKPKEETGSNTVGGEGKLEISYSFGEADPVYIDELNISVKLENAGNIFGAFGIFQRSEDTGNDYDLLVDVTYMDYVSSS